MRKKRDPKQSEPVVVSYQGAVVSYKAGSAGILPASQSAARMAALLGDVPNI